MEIANLLISQSISTTINNKVAVRVTNTTETRYLIKKTTQPAEFSVVTPEQYKFLKPVDTTILSMIPEGDQDLTAYLNELLRTNKPKQQSNSFWFPTPEYVGQIGDHTPIPTRILKGMYELKQKEKLKSRDDTESQRKFLVRFDWNSTLLKGSKKTSNWRSSGGLPSHNC